MKRTVRNNLPGPFGNQGVLGSGVNGGFDVNTWLEKLSDSGWLKHIQSVINGAVLAATLIHVKKTSVVVHCTHGWDRTAQLTSLPMLMLDPYYRTLVGFQVLIEKEWIAYGHKFLDRCNHTASQQLAKEESPIFLQFLDCVHQMLVQFPTQFEFNERFLIDLLDAVYSCQYGTFLANNPLQHTRFETQRKTVSAWSYFNHSSVRTTYMNPLYDAIEARKDPITFLKPSTAGNKLVFWDALFTRSDNDPNADAFYVAKCSELKTLVDHQAAEIAILKAQLSALAPAAAAASGIHTVSPSVFASAPMEVQSATDPLGALTIDTAATTTAAAITPETSSSDAGVTPVDSVLI